MINLNDFRNLLTKTLRTEMPKVDYEDRWDASIDVLGDLVASEGLEDAITDQQWNSLVDFARKIAHR